MEAATPEMFDDIYPLVSALNPGFSREKWRVLIDYPWRADGDGLGYVLIERGEVVGFISTLFSSRTIDGREVRFCNTAHWVVREAFRADSLRLLMAVMRQRELTLTNLTSTKTVSTLMEKLGFQLLDRNVQLLFPEPVVPGGGGGALVTSDRALIQATLTGADRRIFADHQSPECGHIVARDGDGYCYIVFTRMHRTLRGIRIPYCHIHYISDRAIFRRRLARIKWFFLRRLGALFVAVDERMAGEQSRWFSRRYPLGAPRYYRSTAVAPGQVDNLYTELVLGV